tara:strand:+ start:1217 stop:1486 length:270 start_codon:yes stop_codon:yes gene_type:complete
VECCQSLSVCGGKTLFKIGKTPVMQLTGDGTSSGGGAFYWTSKLDVDADGSPNAYNPQVDQRLNPAADWLGKELRLFLFSKLTQCFLFP